MAFVKMMQQGSGKMFIISYRPGTNAKERKGMVACGLGKSLIFSLEELMNDETKEHNVGTGIALPSTINTSQNRKDMIDGKFDNWVKVEAIANAI